MSSQEARATFAAVLRRAEQGHTTVVTNHGRRVAAIVPVDVADYIEQIETEYLLRAAREAKADPEPSIPLAEVARELGF
ncbi:hypothetical protein TOK_4682 [Pseudonocardia sp. N23]|nr:hypothetical protein TOK_4682 [Pseudonocardia sp. N23]